MSRYFSEEFRVFWLRKRVYLRCPYFWVMAPSLRVVAFERPRSLGKVSHPTPSDAVRKTEVQRHKIGAINVHLKLQNWSTRRCGWLRHWAASRKVAGSIPDGVIGIFYWHNPSGCTMALGSTQPLTEMSTINISWGVKAAGAYGWQPYYLQVQIVLKSENLKLLEPSGLSRLQTTLLL